MRAFFREIIILIFLASFSVLFSLDLSVRTTSEKNSFYIDIFPGSHEVVYKDSIRLSLDDDYAKILKWSIVEGEAQEDYVVPLKLHKKVYGDRFAVRVVLSDRISSLSSLYVSCFVVKRDEVILPVIRRLSLVCFGRARLPEAKATRSYRGEHHESRERNFIERPPGQAINIFLFLAFGVFVLLTFFALSDIVIVLLAAAIIPILVKIYLFFVFI
jgi:hypothetical protein